LERLVQKTKDDYGHHAWGNGAVYMESWGCGALAANRLDAAEEAFLEALAHDTGSARAAMGLQVLCERQGRSAEAHRYAALARKFWSKAPPQHCEAEFNWIRSLGVGDKTSKRCPRFAASPQRQARAGARPCLALWARGSGASREQIRLLGECHENFVDR